MDRILFKLGIISLGFNLSISCVFAATPIDVSDKGLSYLQSYVNKSGFTAGNKIALQERKREFDMNRTLHMRAKQTYAGYPVWGGDIIVHVPQSNKKIDAGLAGVISAADAKTTSMNGTLYQDLDKDLQNVPSYIFNENQARKALDQAVNLYQHELGANFEIKDYKNQLIVYLDNQHKAHWAFYVSLHGEKNGFPTMPVYMLDAINLQVLKHWNEVKQYGLSKVKGGGYGGNEKMGKLIYDGQASHLPALDMQRDKKNKICYLKNKDVAIYNYKNNNPAQFKCIRQNPLHNDIYWDENFDKVNGGYSPSNDALYAGAVIKNLYNDWYHIPVLTKYEAPMQIVMVMHMSDPTEGFPDQAIWDPESQIMYFGDGEKVFYPLTSIGVTAHEISHGFTEQHSNLDISDAQSGGLNESFSDMAAQAAEYFVNGKPSWKMCSEITKFLEALRFLDKPSKDCDGAEAGEDCSLETLDQYNKYIERHKDDVNFNVKTYMIEDRRQPDVHFSSGIFNHVFYLLAHSPNWDVRKAFDVMVQANRFYWVETSTFKQAACGVVKATEDLKYDLSAVKKAFEQATIDISEC